jgi:hypothetical protein
MSSRIRKSKRSLIPEEMRSSLEMRVNEERLSEMLEIVALKDVPLEERRREANKTLYLIGYE